MRAPSPGAACGGDHVAPPATDNGGDATLGTCRRRATRVSTPKAATRNGAGADLGSHDRGRPAAGGMERPCGPPRPPALDAVEVAQGARFSSTVGLTHAPGDRGAV
jgi:hypothetical protein